jgi:paraquat-inducible protein A
MFERYKRNDLASILAFLGICCLVPAYFMDFFNISQFGTEKSYSMLGGISALFREGNPFLGSILFIFSVLFPMVKLLAIIIITTSFVEIPYHIREKLHALAQRTAKYSMLDIYVVANLIVALKAGEFISVKIKAGVILFCVTIFMSAISGLCVKLKIRDSEGKHKEGVREMKEGASTRQKPPKYIKILLISALLILPFGLFLTLSSSFKRVDEVELTQGRGLNMRDLVPVGFDGNPDFYLVLLTKAGIERTACYKETAIGNGLSWELDRNYLLSDIYEVQVFDKNLLMDKQLDRMQGNNRMISGQHFRIRLKGPPSILGSLGFVLALLSSLTVFGISIWFLKSQTISD